MVKVKVKTTGHKCFVYPKFLKDLWTLGLLGVLKTNRRLYKRVTKFFFNKREKGRSLWKYLRSRYAYRLDLLQEKEKKRLPKKGFATIRLVKFFYLILSYHHFKAMARAARKKDGFFEGHYCLALEGRLLNFIYRTGFVASLFEALAVVRQRWCTVDRKLKRHPNEKVQLYKLLAFHPLVKKRAYFDLWVRLCINRRSLFNSPRYMFLSYWFLFAFMFQYPYKKDLALPKFIDIYRATGYAH